MTKHLAAYICLLLIFSPTVLAYKYKESFISFEANTKKNLKSSFKDKKVYPASLTKLLTAYIILRDTDNLATRTTISKKAWGFKFENSSRMFLEPRTTVSINNLLKGLLVQSGNDAATALAEHHSGTLKAFVMEMNKTAKKLGMLKSNFTNPHGRHNKNHFTTANDFKALVIAITKNTPEIYKYTTLESFKFNHIIQYNRNKTLGHLNSLGLKTGFTPQSGYNLASCYDINKGIFCTIEFGNPRSSERFLNSMAAAEMFFDTFEVFHPINIDQVFEIGSSLYTVSEHNQKSILIDKGDKPSVKINFDDSKRCENYCEGSLLISTTKKTHLSPILLKLQKKSFNIK